MKYAGKDETDVPDAAAGEGEHISGHGIEKVSSAESVGQEVHSAHPKAHLRRIFQRRRPASGIGAFRQSEQPEYLALKIG